MAKQKVEIAKKCTNQQKWIPKTYKTELINRIYFTNNLRRELSPRVNGIKTDIRPLATLNEAWCSIYNGLWASDDFYIKVEGREESNLWKKVISYKENYRKIGKRVINTKPTILSFEDDILFVKMINDKYHGFYTYPYENMIYPALADFYINIYGVEKTIELFLITLNKLPYMGVAYFERLREIIVLEGLDNYKKLRDNLYKFYKELYKKNQKADLAWAMSYLFPISSISGNIENDIHKDALKSVTTSFGNCDIHASGLASGNLKTLQKFREKNYDTGHEFFSSTYISYAPFYKIYLASLMEQEGVLILDDLLKMKPSDPWEDNYTQNYKWCYLLAHFDDDKAINKLFKERKKWGISDYKAWGTDALLKASVFQKDRVVKIAKELKDTDFINLLKETNFENLNKHIVKKLKRDDDFILNMVKKEYLIPQNITVPHKFKPIVGLKALKTKEYFKMKTTLIWKEKDLERAKDKEVINKAENLYFNGVELDKLNSEQLEEYLLHCEKYSIPATIEELIFLDRKSAIRRKKVGFKIRYYTRGLFYLVKFLDTEASDIVAKGLNSKDSDNKLSFFNAASIIGSLDIAPIIIINFVAKKYKAHARKWILRFPKYSIASAISFFLNGNEKEKTASIRALFFLKGQGYEKEILKFVKKLNKKVEEDELDKIKELLKSDPLLFIPKKKYPKIPKYISEAKLPNLLNKKRKELSQKEVEKYLIELAYSLSDEPHPNILLAKKELNKKSMIEFSWTLFELWLDNGANSKEYWCMYSVGFWGDDSSVIKIAKLMKDWPGQGYSKRAQAALDILLNIGSDLALVNINLLAEKSRFDGFKSAAKERIEMLADKLNLTSEELSDRLVPTFDFENGGNILDFGSRKFFIKFDEQLKPYLLNEDNKKLKTLPKPNKKDNKILAKEAKTKFSNIKKLSKQSAQLQLLRLEKMLQSQREINKDSFIKNFAKHPWMKFITKNLLWVDKTADQYFRIDGDGSLVDKNDDEFKLNSKSKITLVHPINMSKEDIDFWVEVFDDYEIIQPFNQLNRELFYITDEDKKSKNEIANRFSKTFEPYKLSKLEKNGWGKWTDSCINGIYKHINKESYYVIHFDRGWCYGETPMTQDVYSITLYGKKRTSNLSKLEFSEMIYEIKKALE